MPRVLQRLAVCLAVVLTGVMVETPSADAAQHRYNFRRDVVVATHVHGRTYRFKLEMGGHAVGHPRSEPLADAFVTIAYEPTRYRAPKGLVTYFSSGVTFQRDGRQRSYFHDNNRHTLAVANRYYINDAFLSLVDKNFRADGKEHTWTTKVSFCIGLRGLEHLRCYSVADRIRAVGRK